MNSIRSLRGLTPRISVLWNPHRCASSEQCKKEVHEVKIPVPWGHIAGKWWGNTQQQPVIAVHGWQDNCGTWDTLVPLLSPEVTVLAIDLPGHGFSSHIPAGLSYQATDILFFMKFILKHYRWDKVTLLAHSMGSAQSFIYSSVFPDEVDKYIAIDALKPLSIDPKKDLVAQSEEVNNVLDITNLDTSQRPKFNYDEMMERAYEKMIARSVTKDSCKILLRRGMVPAGNVMSKLFGLIKGRHTVYVNALRQLSSKTDVAHGLKEFEEIKIPVPWGHIAGKWWGKENPNIFLALHGWQDNAGTWDTLIPLLPNDISVLAIDSPGHGFSSHLQPGLVYHNIESLKFLRLVVKYFNWEKVSFLAHSAGAIQSFIYSSIFPENVDKLISIDTLKPTSAKPEKEVLTLGKKIDQFLDIMQYDSSKSPVYSYEELLTRLSDSVVKNSLTQDSAKILLKRGATPIGDGKYRLNRDIRLKKVQFIGFTHEQVLEMAANITSKILYIKGSNGLQIEDPKIEEEIINILQNSAESFEKHVVQGTHHVHLNSPHEVAPIINQFINKT